jgi:hypothetical protein
VYKESYVERVSDKGVTGEGTVLYIYDKGVRVGGYRTCTQFHNMYRYKEGERYRDMEGESWKFESRDGLKERHRVEKGKRVDRSPQQEQDVRGIRRRLEETDLGYIFGSISKVMRREMEAVVGKAPRLIQESMKEGMDVMVRAVEETMSRISEREKWEGRERKEKEGRREDQLARIEERLQKLERKSESGWAEMEKNAEVGLTEVKEKIKEVEMRIEGAVRVESRVKELEEKAAEEKEKVEDKEQQGAPVLDVVIGQIGKIRMMDSVKEMEGKVRVAMCGVKVGNFNIGQETEDKALIVRKVLGEVRKAVKNEDAGRVDRVLKRTRVIVLGKRTEEKREGGETIQSVPILLQCQDRKDAQELEGALKGAGYFPTLHWPDEMMDFIKGVREEVRRRGVTEHGSWIRVRPEEVEGRVRIRVDTKAKTGGRFRLEGVWVCPPLNRFFWEMMDRLYTPLYVGEGSGGIR